MRILILAGGFATRLWPLTDRRAKPLLLLDGKTILAHILEKIPKNFEVVLLTNKRFKSDFKEELEKLERTNVEIFCEDAFSDKEKLGALGAVSMAIRHYNIDENVLVVAGDNLLPELKIEQLFCSGNEAITAVRRVKDLYEAKKFGVVETNGQEIENREQKVGNNCEKLIVKAFEEKPEHPKSTLVSTGFFGIGKDLLPILHDFSEMNPDNLGGVFAEFLNQEKQVMAVEIAGEWFDVGSFETYLEAHKKLQNQKSKIKSQKFIKGNTFSGKVFVGEDCELKNCQIRDSIIYPGVKLENCIISQSVIDEGCDFEGLDLNRKLVRRGTTLHSVNNEQ